MAFYSFWGDAKSIALTEFSFEQTSDSNDLK